MARQLLRKPCFYSLVFSCCFLAPAYAREGDRVERPRQPTAVSWVNPSLPEGPGLEHHVIDSESLGHEVGYVVWTPPGYEGSDKRYPVVYFLHGFGGNESQDAAAFSQWMSRGADLGWTPETVVVFPNGGRSGYRGGVEKMILDELIPRVDSLYRTRAGGGSRAVVGFSMGGMGAMRLSLLHPTVFCAAGSWGGGFRRGGEEALESLRRNATALKQGGFDCLLVNGDQDNPDAYEDLVLEMKRLGVSSRVVVLPETPHKLGRYYELNGEDMVRFLGAKLRQ